MKDYPLTDAELSEIETRAIKASPGPWMKNGKLPAGWRIDDCDENKLGMDFVMNPVGIILTDANAAFVSEAREDIPNLIAEIRRLKSELDKPCEHLAP